MNVKEDLNVEFGEHEVISDNRVNIGIKVNGVNNMKIRLENVKIHSVERSYIDEIEVVLELKKTDLEFFKELQNKINTLETENIYCRRYKNCFDEYCNTYYYIDENTGKIEEVKDVKECIRVRVTVIVKHKDYCISTLKKKKIIKSMIIRLNSSVYLHSEHDTSNRKEILYYIYCDYDSIIFENDEIDNLNKRIRMLEELVYMPNGIGYDIAKNDFDNLTYKINNQNKK